MKLTIRVEGKPSKTLQPLVRDIHKDATEWFGSIIEDHLKLVGKRAVQILEDVITKNQASKSAAPVLAKSFDFKTVSTRTEGKVLVFSTAKNPSGEPYAMHVDMGTRPSKGRYIPRKARRTKTKAGRKKVVLGAQQILTTQAPLVSTGMGVRIKTGMHPGIRGMAFVYKTLRQMEDEHIAGTMFSKAMGLA